MGPRLYLRSFELFLALCLSGIPCSCGIAQHPADSFKLTLISGTDEESLGRARQIAKRAEEVEGFTVESLKSPKVDRVIGIYDWKFAIQFDGETTIAPIVDRISADQNVAHFFGNEKSLKTDDLIEICNLLPWDANELPSDVEFYRSFDDPAKLTSFASNVSEKDTPVLIYLRDLESRVGPIRYAAGTKLSLKQDSKKIKSLLVIGFESTDLDLSDKQFSLPETSQPTHKVFIGRTVMLLARSNKDDSATKYLHKWMDQIEKRERKAKTIKQPK